MADENSSGTGDKIVVKIDADLEELIPGYLKTKREDIDSMHKGLDEGDFENIRIIGHSMKGSGGGYGFDRITEIGSVIEKSALEKNADEIKKQVNELSSYLDRVEIVYE